MIGVAAASPAMTRFYLLTQNHLNRAAALIILQGKPLAPVRSADREIP
jgi:hypothetical protein